MDNLSGKLVVVFVWLLIFSIGIAYSAVFLQELFVQNLIAFVFVTIAFAPIFLLLVISYARSTCTNPGNPQLSLVEQYRVEGKLQKLIQESRQRSQRKKQLRRERKRGQNRKQLQEEQIKNLQLIDYCFKCENVKQLRVHHCKICNRCILRMDHHCPWIGTCVGRNNHKYFILFLFYATIGLLFVSISILIDYFSGGPILTKLTDNQRYLMYAVCVASFLLVLSIGFLFLTQLIASLQNLTTLDTFIPGIQQHNPFDTNSIYDNLSEIFGRGNIWILPTKPKLQTTSETGNYYSVFQ